MIFCLVPFGTRRCLCDTCGSLTLGAACMTPTGWNKRSQVSGDSGAPEEEHLGCVRWPRRVVRDVSSGRRQEADGRVRRITLLHSLPPFDSLSDAPL